LLGTLINVLSGVSITQPCMLSKLSRLQFVWCIHYKNNEMRESLILGNLTKEKSCQYIRSKQKITDNNTFMRKVNILIAVMMT
jgi:hypothetical protein